MVGNETCWQTSIILIFCVIPLLLCSPFMWFEKVEYVILSKQGGHFLTV